MSLPVRSRSEERHFECGYWLLPSQFAILNLRPIYDVKFDLYENKINLADPSIGPMIGEYYTLAMAI